METSEPGCLKPPLSRLDSGAARDRKRALEGCWDPSRRGKDIQDSECLDRSAKAMAAEDGIGRVLFPGASLPFSADPSFLPKQCQPDPQTRMRNPLAAAKKEIDVVVANKLPASHRGYGTILPARSPAGSLSVVFVLILVCGGPVLQRLSTKLANGYGLPSPDTPGGK